MSRECFTQTMPGRTSYTESLTSSQADKLRAILEEKGFEFQDRPYSLFSAQRDKLNVSVYAKGPKVLVQGKDTEDFVRFVLEPLVLGEVRMGYEEERFPEMFAPHFGIDESGKGDFFGPLVVTGVYVDRTLARAFLDLGVCDSKRIGSDARIRQLARAIRETSGSVVEVVLIGPARYNELHSQIGNLNRLLAWGHASVLVRLAARLPECPRALSDQFARPRLLEEAVRIKGITVKLEQRTKAESDVAVAAASIIARERFIDWLDRRSTELGCRLPRGASLEVQALAHDLRYRFGDEALAKIAKMHFRFACG
ncbi:MAG TPA: ribonuclease HIII [Verrucomicrobiales bacterium]|nr:ribonuclease HIII [Verrucomicrobiales bacterium]